MAWKNKRKVHFARGNSNKIIALSEQTTNYTSDDIIRNMFTDGQPLHIKDRNYLAIADTYTIGTTRVAPKLMEPIKTRTLEGYGSDIDSNGNYLLTTAKTNHYKLTGDSQRTYLSSFNDFYLQRETANGNITLLSLENDGNKDYILINENNYLKSNNVHSANIKDLAGNDAISLGAAITLLKDLNTNKNITSNGQVNLYGSVLNIGQDIEGKRSSITIYGNINQTGNYDFTGTLTLNALDTNSALNVKTNINFYDKIFRGYNNTNNNFMLDLQHVNIADDTDTDKYSYLNINQLKVTSYADINKIKTTEGIDGDLKVSNSIIVGNRSTLTSEKLTVDNGKFTNLESDTLSVKYINIVGD